MDTVYLPGMIEQQPFRLDGDRAYGLGIADDKHGVAVVLHTLGVLQALDFDDYGLLTVLINADEEVSSAGSRSIITALGREHDAVFSCEGSSGNRVRLRTSGIGAFNLVIRGRAAHAGGAPEDGRNALYELAHQIMQTRDLSDPEVGLKMNWTVGTGGNTRNVIPAEARATADVRVQRVEDYERIETEVRRRMRNQLIPDTEIDLVFERRRPPLVVNQASRRLAAHAQEVLSRARHEVDGRRGGIWRRDRRGLCRARDRRTGHRRDGAPGVRRSLEPSGVCEPGVDRATSLPLDTTDHGLVGGETPMIQKYAIA